MVEWDEAAGRVSYPFSEWFLVDVDQRAFLRFAQRFGHEGFARIWRAIAESPGDPNSEVGDLFDRAVGNLNPLDFTWMVNAAVIRDSVTSYEVYVEKAYDDIRRHHGDPSVGERAPKWPSLKDFFRVHLDIDVEPKPVAHVRDLRHLLTHRRGELRTDESRRRWATGSEYFGPREVELSETQVLAHLDTLGRQVRTVDPLVWRYSVARDRLKTLS